MKSDLYNLPGLPEFDPMQLVHGEHSAEFYREFAPGERLQLKERILDV